MLNCQNLYLQKQRLVLRLLLSSSQILPLRINKVAVFIPRLLYKGLICDEIFWWYVIHVTHTKFLVKLCNLLVLLNYPKM